MLADDLNSAAWRIRTAAAGRVRPPQPGGYGPPQPAGTGPPAGPRPAVRPAARRYGAPGYGAPRSGFDFASVNPLDWGIIGGGVLALIFSFFELLQLRRQARPQGRSARPRASGQRL